jgi:thymidylate kinase
MGYLKLARQNPRRIKVVPLAKKVATTQAMIREIVERRLRDDNGI